MGAILSIFPSEGVHELDDSRHGKATSQFGTNVLYKQYVTFMREYTALGHMTKITSNLQLRITRNFSLSQYAMFKAARIRLPRYE